MLGGLTEPPFFVLNILALNLLLLYDRVTREL